MGGYHGGEMSTNKVAPVDAFHEDTVRLSRAAQLGLSALVPSCPGWNVANLLIHLARRTLDGPPSSQRAGGSGLWASGGGPYNAPSQN